MLKLMRDKSEHLKSLNLVDAIDSRLKVHIHVHVLHNTYLHNYISMHISLL